MKISKKDALMWFEFFSMLPEDEELLTNQQEIALATFSQIEAAIDAVREPIERDVLKMRFLNGLYCGDIGRKLGYTRQNVDRICREALKKVQVPRDAEPVEEAVRRAMRERRTPRRK